jgi:antitoxin ParD1/3/4
MPTRNVSLTEELDRFITERVASGRYENASEVVRAALRSLEYEEQDRAEKEEWLRQALDEGLASGIARGDVFAQVKREARRIVYGKK